jgi:hypothetical protein
MKLYQQCLFLIYLEKRYKEVFIHSEIPLYAEGMGRLTWTCLRHHLHTEKEDSSLHLSGFYDATILYHRRNKKQISF